MKADNNSGHSVAQLMGTQSKPGVTTGLKSRQVREALAKLPHDGKIYTSLGARACMCTYTLTHTHTLTQKTAAVNATAEQSCSPPPGT